MRRLKVVGISSGIGVSLFPFKKEKILGNIEPRYIFHTSGNEQWGINFPGVELSKQWTNKYNKKEVDLVVSSPDCGSGSILRYSRAKKLGNHKENHSLLLFFKGIRKIKPKFFLFENLDGLFKSFPKDEFEAQLSDYRLVIHNCSVSEFGNSQRNRKRLIVVGIRNDLVKEIDSFFNIPLKMGKLKLCGELYGDLKEKEIPSIGHVRESLDTVISIYSRKKMSLGEIQAYWLKNKGKRWKVTDRNFSTAPGVYRNPKKSYPATARKANRQYDHKGLTLTPRQLARIQGIPDDFKIYIDLKKKGYWINKSRAAVTKTPPFEISLWFYTQILKTYNLWT